MIPFEWQGHTWLLHPHRCIYWEKHRVLILSDLHLGKTGHFRQEGIAVPQQVLQDDLHRLFTLITYFHPVQVLLTGDLFHSRANREWDLFTRRRMDVPHIDFLLVQGNHDRQALHALDAMHIRSEPCYTADGIYFVHHPENKAGSPNAPNPLPTMAGHIHPAVMVPTGARQKMRLPCFYFSPGLAILPAFSRFTGTHIIKPKAADTVFALTGNAVIAV